MGSFKKYVRSEKEGGSMKMYKGRAVEGKRMYAIKIANSVGDFSSPDILSGKQHTPFSGI